MHQFKEKNGNFYIEGDDRFYAHYLAKDCFMVYMWEDETYDSAKLLFIASDEDTAALTINEYIEENPNV